MTEVNDRERFKAIKADLIARGLFTLYPDYVKVVACSFCSSVVDREELCAEVRSICCTCFFERLTPEERERCELEDLQAKQMDDLVKKATEKPSEDLIK